MKLTHIAAAALIALFVPAAANAATLTINVENIETHEGTLRVGVYTVDGYDAGKTVSGANIAVDAATATATVEGLEPGEYGIKLFHDVNDDGEMATNPFGMPTEPFAFSNDAKGRFGPAKWDAAKFTVSADGTVHTINMK